MCCAQDMIRSLDKMQDVKSNNIRRVVYISNRRYASC